MKVVIIGSHGFVGRHLITFLEQQGIECAGFSSSMKGGIDPVNGLLSPEFTIPKETDVIFYLAQSPYYHQVPQMAPHIMTVNVATMVKVAEIGRRSGVRHFVYASTGSAYAPGFQPLSEDAPLQKDNWYILSKVQGEEALSFYRKDMNVTIIRPFGIYGPGQVNKLVPNLINSVLHDEAVTIYKHPNDEDDLDGLRISLCYIDDAVKILYKLIAGGKKIDYLNVAGMRAVSVREIATLIGKYSGKKPRYKIKNEYRTFDLIADISILEKTLEPKFLDIQDGVRKTVEAVVGKQDW